MIHEELTGCMQSLSATLESSATAALTGESVSLEDYRWQVERLSSAAQSIGLNGLHEFLARVLEASCLVESAASNEVPQQCEVLDRWPPLVDEYLQPLASEAASRALVDYITAQEFAMPLDAASAAGLCQHRRRNSPAPCNESRPEPPWPRTSALRSASRTL